METELKAAIEQSLQHELLDNAVFLAERLFALGSTPESLHTLANCYYKNGEVSRAFSTLDNHISNGLPINDDIRYLYGLCGYKLRKYTEAEKVLEQGTQSFGSGEMEGTGESASAAAVYHVLGDICIKTNRPRRAVEHYVRALHANPYLWTAYSALCRLGADVQAEDVFRSNEDDRVTKLYFPAAKSTSVTDVSQTAFTPTQATPMFKTPFTADQAGPQRLNFETPATGGVTSVPAPSTPAFVTPSPSNTGAPHSALPPPAPYGDVSKAPNTEARAAMRETDIDTTSGRKGGRSLSWSQSNFAVGHNARLSFGGDLGATPKLPSGQVAAAPHISGPVPVSDPVEINSALDLLAHLGRAHKHRTAYDCQTAITLFRQTPLNQFNTAWVMCEVGRAHFELVQYAYAKEYYEKARELDPSRSQGMETYSTILWHMRKEVEISYLAQQMVNQDRLSPWTWCVVGNCFSLQKDHETALKFFKRALQLDPNCTYAHTLCGHEYLAIEDFDKSLACFRTAIRTDERHYNGWYGIGLIYYRQEKYELAYYHFLRAVSINRHSSVLYCYLGMVLHANAKPERALEMLQCAVERDPRNPLAKFKKANVLLSLNKYIDALAELQELKEIAPKESAVYFLLGKLYRKLGDNHNAMINVSMALNLDPRDNTSIKNTIESMANQDTSDIDEDNEEFSFS